MASIFDWSVTTGDNDDADTDINWLEGQAGQTINNSARAMMAKVGALVKALKGAYVTTNVSNAYSIAVDFEPSALSKGWVGIVRFNAANTGAATLAIGSLAAADLRDRDGTALSSGFIAANSFHLVMYDTTASYYRILSKAASSSIASTDITDFTEAVQDVVGALSGFGGVGLTFSYNDGAGTVTLDADTATDSASGIAELATTTETITGTDTGRVVTPDGLAALWEAGANITDGATITIGEGGYFNLITSTTAITAFTITTDKAGRSFRVRFDTARTLTHNATSLILPGGANITTAQGDIAFVRSLGSGNVVVEHYSKANGQAVGAAATTPMTYLGSISTASGASATLSSLTLTNYSHLLLLWMGVSHSAGAAQTFMMGQSVADDIAVTNSVDGTDTVSGTQIIKLSTGESNAALTPGSRNATTAIVNASTAIYIQASSGNLDGGAIKVYGMP